MELIEHSTEIDKKTALIYRLRPDITKAEIDAVHEQVRQIKEGKRAFMLLPAGSEVQLIPL